MRARFALNKKEPLFNQLLEENLKYVVMAFWWLRACKEHSEAEELVNKRYPQICWCERSERERVWKKGYSMEDSHTISPRWQLSWISSDVDHGLLFIDHKHMPGGVLNSKDASPKLRHLRINVGTTSISWTVSCKSELRRLIVNDAINHGYAYSWYTSCCG